MADVVLVASGGGHLEQLFALADRIPIEGKRRWVTFDTPQSRSMLAGQDVMFVPYLGPRDYTGLLKNLRLAPSIGSRSTVAGVVSTGSGLALAYLPLSAARGIPTWYIESATRVQGPSFSGKVLARTPGVKLMTQHERWADTNWHFGGSVFEGYESVEKPISERPQSTSDVRRVVVSLGTIKGFGFRRLLDRLLEILPSQTEVIWQTGFTDTSDMDITAHSQIPHQELIGEITAADVLVAHAGTGIALTAFKAGVLPVLVPREAAHREHIDDHQAQTARLLGDGGLAVTTAVNELTLDHLVEAASREVVRREHAPALQMAGSI